MSKREFSSGIPQLDEYVSGFLPGDFTCAFLSRSDLWKELVASSVAEARKRKIPVIHLSVHHLRSLQITHTKKEPHFEVPAGRISFPRLISSIQRFLSTKGRGAWIVLDELSLWHERIGSERRLLEVLEAVAKTSARIEASLFTGIDRANLSMQFLRDLKDRTTICLEVIQQRDGFVILPLTLKGRYSPLQALPLRLKNFSSSGSIAERTVAESPASPGGEPKEVPAGSYFLDERYREVFQNAGEAMFLFNVRGDFREANQRAADLLGMSKDELERIKPTVLIALSDRRAFLRNLIMLRRKKSVTQVMTIEREGDTDLRVECRCSSLGNDYFLAVLYDIGSRLAREDELVRVQREYLELIEHHPDGIAVLSNQTFLYANARFLTMFGITSPDGLGTAQARTFFAPDSWRGLQRALRDADSGAGKIEMRCVARDGSIFETHLGITEIIFDRKKCFELSITDLSGQKKIIEALSASEARYRSLVDGSLIPLAVLAEGRVQFINNAGSLLFGHANPDALNGKESALLVEESSRESFSALLAAKGNTKKIAGIGPISGVRNDRSTFDLEVIFAPPSHGGSVIAAFRDISEECIVRRELEARKGELNALKEIHRVLAISHDPLLLYRKCTDTLASNLSWEIGALYIAEAKKKELYLRYDRHASEEFKKQLSVLPVDEGLGGYLAKTKEPLFIAMKKYPNHLPHRKIFQGLGLHSLLLLPLLSGDAFLGMIILGSKHEKGAASYSSDLLGAIASDIGTAIANANEFAKVGGLAEQYGKLIEGLSSILFIAAPNGRMQYISPGVEKLTGYSQKDYYRDSSLWLKLVHPDDKKLLLERTTHLNEHQGIHRIDYRILPRGKASYRVILDEASFEHDAEGNTVFIRGSLTDITDERARVEELLTQENRRGSVLASIQEGMLVVDRDLRCVQWNPAMERITGRLSADVLGQSPAPVFPHMEQHRITEFLRQALNGEDVHVDDLRYYIPGTNKIGYLWARFSPVKDLGGTITAVVCLMHDFTDRKQLELEMRDSEQVLRNVIDTMGDILLIADLKGNVLEVNKSFLRILGYSRSETIGHEFPYQWVLEEEMGRFVLWIAELRERNWLHDFDMTWRAKDGRMIPMSLSTTLLRNSMGEPIATLNIARDITERKRLTKDLESRTRQIEMINRIISKANETMDFDEIFHSIAGEINEVIASDLINIGILTEDEKSLTVYPLKGTQALHKGDTIPIEKTLSRIAIASGKPVVVADLSADEYHRSFSLFTKGLRSQISFPIVLKGKAFGALNIGSKTPNFYGDPDAQILQPIAQQIGTIIDRVQLFRQVTEDSAYIHNLLDSINSIVYTVDTQYRIREVNKAWHEFMQESGFPGIRNYQGMNLFDVLPSENLKETFRHLVEEIISGNVRMYSQEFIHTTISGERIYQLTINPMTIDRKITGLVFTHTDITALKKTEEQLKRSNEQLLALNKISTLISTSLDLNEIMETTIPLMRRETESDAVLVYLIDQRTQDLTLTKQIGFEDSASHKIRRLTHGSSVTGSVVLTKEPLYISEKAFLDERIIAENREVLRRANLHAMAVIPLASKNQVWGALDIFYDTPHEFSPQEQQMLSLVGNQLGTAIENAQLYRELRSQIDRLTVLYEVSQHLTSTLEIDQIFSAVHESIQHVVPYERFSIALYDSWTNSTTVVFQATTRQGTKSIDAERHEPRTLTPDAPESIVAGTKRSHQDPEHRAMYVPMLSKEIIIGIMSVVGSPDVPYTETHLRLLESVGNLTALAVEKAKLYEETVKISLEIQRRNKELDDFTYVVSHDLKEPLISIEGFSRILQADYRDVIVADGKEYLDSIVGATTRMKGLIDDLLMLSRVSRPSEAFKAVALAEVIEDIKTDMEFTIRQKGVNVIIPQPLPTVHGNETQLKIVFRNLIGNAVKFNNKPNPVVEIGFRISENNMYLFHVRDNGIGISKDFFEKVFVIFQRLHRREEYEGTGAGLAIVKKIIETHKGKIWIESEVGVGSTFFFLIPKGTPFEG